MAWRRVVECVGLVGGFSSCLYARLLPKMVNKINTIEYSGGTGYLDFSGRDGCRECWISGKTEAIQPQHNGMACDAFLREWYDVIPVKESSVWIANYPKMSVCGVCSATLEPWRQYPIAWRTQQAYGVGPQRKNMNKDANWLVHDHRKYDEALKDCEFAAEVEDWKTAIKLFNTFVEDLKLHMMMEDEVLYPLLEKESGDPNEDLVLLSYEHDNLVRLLGDLVYVIKRKDFDHFEKSLQPLHKAMVQHNDHEEIVFLSLGTESLLLRRDEILARLDALSPRSQGRSWNF